MPVHFMDSSAIVKRYVREVGSTWVVNLAEPAAGNELFIVRITGVEVVAAFVRRARGGTIAPADSAAAIASFKDDFQNEYQVVEVTEGLVNRALNLAETHGLRGYDAVQLAAACEVNALGMANALPPLIFVSADAVLNAAAQAEGLAMEDPNAHP